MDLLNRQHMQMTDAIARAVVREFEPRFAAIERRLDQCATRADLARFATKADLARFAGKRQMIGWMFAFWLLQSAATVAILRLAAS